MSTFLKFLLMALVWVVLYFGTFHGCIKQEYCPSDVNDGTSAVVPAPVPDNNYAIVTGLGAANVMTGTEWSPMLQDLVARYKANPDKTLEVYGNYYESEPKPADYQNMGFARAARIKDLLVSAGIPAGSILELSRKLSPPAVAEGERFPAATFNFTDTVADTEPEQSNVVSLDKDHIKVRFPYAKSTKRLDGDTEDYLKKLAERLQQTNERVTIVGHTDERGTNEFNMGLGKDRAEFIKSRLVSYGAPAARISTSSKGETDPELDKQTERAYRLNRRAEITLVRQ